jgi:hypothetical protein
VRSPTTAAVACAAAAGVDGARAGCGPRAHGPGSAATAYNPSAAWRTAGCPKLAFRPRRGSSDEDVCAGAWCAHARGVGFCERTAARAGVPRPRRERWRSGRVGHRRSGRLPADLGAGALRAPHPSGVGGLLREAVRTLFALFCVRPAFPLHYQSSADRGTRRPGATSPGAFVFSGVPQVGRVARDAWCAL